MTGVETAGPLPGGRPRTESFVRRLGLGVTPLALALSLAALAVAGAAREALLVALPEEIVFRGVLQGELAARLQRPWLAAVLAALAFALAHLLAGSAGEAPGLALLTFLPGLVFGWLRARTGSVWPAVAAHALANVAWRG